MLSLLDILLLVLSTTRTSASPVRRYLNTSSSSIAITSNSIAYLPTGNIQAAAADHAAYSTASDDCEDISTTTSVDAPASWPAALSTIHTSVDAADGVGPAPTQQYEQASSPLAYTTSTSRLNSPPVPYVTSIVKHANATSTNLPAGTGAANPPASSALSGTTTLTLYTTVGPNAGYAASASASGSGAASSMSSVSASADNGGSTTYGGQTTSMAAYTNGQDISASESHTRSQSRPEHGSQSAPAYASSETSSSMSESKSHTRTRHRPTHPPHEASSEPTPTNSATEQAASSPPAYPFPNASSQSSSADTVTVDPVPTSYVAPSQPYSYSPQQTTTTRMTQHPADPPAIPSSETHYAPEPSPTDSHAPFPPILPTVVTGSPPSPSETTTVTSSSSSSSSSSSTTLAGITIVPVDPDATTVYVTVTTTDAGVTTTVAGPTVTQYA